MLVRERYTSVGNSKVSYTFKIILVSNLKLWGLLHPHGRAPALRFGYCECSIENT
jgi:hypothetical protein